MIDLSFKRTVFSLDLYGKRVQLSAPSVKVSQEYAAKVKKLQEVNDDKGMEEALFDVLEKIGLSREDAAQMENDHLVQLVGKLFSSEKK